MKTLILTCLFSTLTLAIPRPIPLKPHTRRQNQVIPVIVGGPQDTFVPNSLTAAVGDIIQFQFSNGNHTVTQSAADAPCVPLAGGVHSGHIPFADNQTDVGTFNMPVTSAEPLFLYCATGPHCQAGQVMVVNPVSALQVAEYVKASQQSGESVDGSEVVGGTVGKIALATAAFVPAPPEDAANGPPGGGAPPSAPPAAEAAPPAATSAAAPAETTAVSNTPAVLEGIL
ncbi:hypothetical protein ACN47E_009148 [Coniothyrium glycines]